MSFRRSRDSVSEPSDTMSTAAFWIVRPAKQKNARYDASHLEQIRNIKALREKGYTLARIVELKRQTHQEVLNRREIGEPLTVIEIPVDPGISIEFRQEICGLTQPQMIKLAQAFLEVIKSEKDKEAQEEKE